MPIAIKPIDKLQEKFVRRGSAAAPDYLVGVNAPRHDQAASAVAANAAFKAGISQALADDRWAKKLTKMGSEKWHRKASTVGAQRFPQGISSAGPDWAHGVDPFLQVLSAITLPARGPKGDTGNTQRVAAVDAALHGKKLDLLK